MKADRLTVAGLRVHSAAQLRPCPAPVMWLESQGQEQRSQFQLLAGAQVLPFQVVGNSEYRQQVAFDIEIAVDEGFSERDLTVVPAESVDHAGIMDPPGKAAKPVGFGIQS